MMHPELLQSLARNRAADLRSAATGHRGPRRRSLRMAAGQAFIEMGLRLTSERPAAVPAARSRAGRPMSEPVAR